ncbi:MAG: hypothetical protein ACYTAN_01260 [Planctomycetota bacterium]|jgi:tetratricopeptide (TPR) repeat protein
MRKKRDAVFQFLLVFVLLTQGCALSASEVETDAANTGPAADAVLERVEARLIGLDYEGARRLLLKTFQAQNRDPRIVAALAQAELMLNQPGAAVAHLEVGLVWHRDDTRLLLWLALAQATKGLGKQADSTLERALALAGENETALYDLAEEFLRKGALSISSALYERIISVYPADSQFDIFSRLNLASHYFHRERYEDAARVMRQAARPMEYGDVDLLTPQESAYWIAIFAAMAEIERGGADEGIRRLRAAAADFPLAAVADALVVKELGNAGRTEEARAVYTLVSKRLESAIGKKPENGQAYNDLALFEAISETDAENGLKYCEWALTLEPLRPEYYDTRSALLMQLGRNEDALIAVNRAVSILSSPRWGEPGFLISLIWRRLEILREMDIEVPGAFISLD